MSQKQPQCLGHQNDSREDDWGVDSNPAGPGPPRPHGGIRAPALARLTWACSPRPPRAGRLAPSQPRGPGFRPQATEPEPGSSWASEAEAGGEALGEDATTGDGRWHRQPRAWPCLPSSGCRENSSCTPSWPSRQVAGTQPCSSAVLTNHQPGKESTDGRQWVREEACASEHNETQP